jgi:glycosyltransferase involved in cell wall biosynthesis
VVLFLHNRYRNPGGEEVVVERLERLVSSLLGVPVARAEAASSDLSPFLAALYLVGGGSRREARRLGQTVRGEGRVIVHAHNLHPVFGVRALRAAKAAGAAVVLHLHQFRLVCAVGTCFTAGRRCTSCHGRNTLPGVLKRCRGNLAEGVAYAAGLSLWQPAIVAAADRLILPSRFAIRRLEELGLEVGSRPHLVLAPPIPLSPRPGRRDGGFALIAARLSAEKGVDLGLQACGRAGIPVVVAGEGPERRPLEALASRLGVEVTFAGRLSQGELERLREAAAVAVVPSRSENFPTAAAEAMAWGVPVAATAVGGTGELVPGEWLAPPDDVEALAATIARLAGDRAAGEVARERVAAVCDPIRVGEELAAIYRGLGLAVPAPASRQA